MFLHFGFIFALLYVFLRVLDVLVFHAGGVSKYMLVLAAFLICMPSLLGVMEYKRVRISVAMRAQVVLFITAGTAILWQLTTITDYISSTGNSLQTQFLGNLVTAFLWLFIGINSSGLPFSRELSFASFIVFIITTALVLLSPKERGLVDFSTLGFEYSHLSIDGQLAVISLIAFSLAKPRWRFLVLLVGCLSALFLGSRGTFVSLVLSGVLTLSFQRSSLMSLNFLRDLVIITLSILVFVILVGGGLSERFFFTSKVGDSTSLLLRLEQLQAGLGSLPEHVWFGDITSSAKYFGDDGYYIHNILSAAQYLGVGFFIALTCVILMALGILRCKASDPNFTLSVTIFLYGLISVLFFKFFTFWVFWFGLGLVLGFRSETMLDAGVVSRNS